MFSSNFFRQTQENRIQAAKAEGIAKGEVKFLRKIGEWQCHREVAGDSGAVQRIELSP